MLKKGGLRKRWLVNTLSVVCSLGLVCILALTAVFAVHNYVDQEQDLRQRAESAASVMSKKAELSENAFYEECITYAETFDKRSDIHLQFLSGEGRVLASSEAEELNRITNTSDVKEAVSSRGVCTYLGQDAVASERILAASAPIIYSNGEIVGILRYTIPTKDLDMQILFFVTLELIALLVVIAAVLISSNYYMRSILVPVAEITEKAQRIAAGSYGIQIQKVYDDEIGDLVETINDLSVKINQNEMMQTEFISSLSHELRTPLTAITGWSETLLAGDSLDKETRRGMRIIQRESRRMTDMVVELLEFTRIQDGRMTLNIEKTDLREEYEDTVFMYGSRLAQEGIDLVYVDRDEEIPEIDCDPRRLRQVFLNILDNAAKHGGEGKKIETSIGCVDDRVIVTIRDFGPGIPEDEIPLVKKKFYKGSSKARGTGIGLAVCEEIVQMHSGTLTLENAEGGGTLVTVSLPVTQ